MAINTYIPTTQTQTTYQPQQRYIGTFFVNSEQEAASLPNPVTGCSFYILDGDNPVLFAKYADGRPMEVYDMQLRAPAPTTQYLTEERFEELMNAKMDELSKKFVIRNDKKEYRHNG